MLDALGQRFLFQLSPETAHKLSLRALATGLTGTQLPRDERLTAAIHIRFGLPAVLPATIKREIKRADRLSAWLEAVQIAGFTRSEADRLFGAAGNHDMRGLTIALRPPVEVRRDYVARHDELSARMVAEL